MIVRLSYLVLQVVILPCKGDGMSYTWPSWQGEAGCRNVSFASHAKSGSQFSSLLGRLLGGIHGLTNFDIHRFSNIDLQSTKIVHFVRDPFALIVSSYNYYLRAVEGNMHTKILGPRNRERLGCDSNVFFTCLWEKNSTAEQLVVMARALLWDEAPIGLPIVDLKTILNMYSTFEELPNAINVCLEDLFVDLNGTLEKILSLIAADCPAVHTSSQLALEMSRICQTGMCNTFAQRLLAITKNTAFKCCLHDTEELCGSFDGEPVLKSRSLLALLSWCSSNYAGECKWVSNARSRHGHVGAYAYPPTNTTSARGCHPDVWEVKCDVDRVFFPASLEDLHNALRTLDPETLHRVTEVSQIMGCKREK